MVALVGNTALILLQITQPAVNYTDEASSLSQLLVALRLAAAFVRGYVAGRISGRWGGLNWIAAVVAGFVLMVVVSVVFLFVSVVVLTFLGMLALRAGIDPNSIQSSSITVGVREMGTVSLVLMFLGGDLGGWLGERHASGARRES